MANTDQDQKNELTDTLQILRESIGLSKEDMAKIIGINSQEYTAIEDKKCKMDSDIFNTLMAFFRCNRKTKSMVKHIR